jgi:hypothetical protein
MMAPKAYDSLTEEQKDCVEDALRAMQLSLDGNGIHLGDDDPTMDDLAERIAFAIIGPN